MQASSYRMDFTLAAGASRRFGAAANYVYCLSQTADVQFVVYDKDQNKLTDWITVLAGQGIRFDGDGYQVEFRTVAGGDFSFLAIVGEFVDNSFIVSSASAVTITPSGTTLFTPNTPISALAAAATLISAGGATIRRRWIRNDDTALTIYLRSNTTLAESAIALPPGGVAILENQSAIYAYNPGGTAVNVYCDQETTT